MALIVFDDFPAGPALMVAALLMIVGWTVAFVVFQIRHRRAVKEFRRELQALEARMTAAIASVRDQNAAREALPSASLQPEQSAPAVMVNGSTATHVAEEISAETLLVLAAAVTVFLGKKVRVRSAQMLQTPFEIVNPWSQQGRAIVQASHNLSPRGHRE
jgi:hypothetical protein